jgi:hypothetical protein
VLRRVFGSKRVEVTEGWTKLHSELPCNLHSSPSVGRKNVTRVQEVGWIA